MKFGVKSDKGLVRIINEDSYNVLAGYTGVPVTFIIADGMGGHNSGEVASKLAVDYTSKQILEYPESLCREESVLASIKEIMEKANSYVYAKSLEHRENAGMGTTLIIAVICEQKLYIGHIGDSRVYHIRDGRMSRITTDHSFIEELIKTGSLTREEAERHPKRNIITRALGCSEEIEIDFYSCEIEGSDIFVMCTDGLTNMVTENEIMEVLEKMEDPELTCDELVQRANRMGGEDNITVIVFNNK